VDRCEILWPGKGGVISVKCVNLLISFQAGSIF
jgi:hypothetical protein